MNRKVFKRRVIITGFLMMSLACFFVYKFIDLLVTDKINLLNEKKSEIRRGYIKDRHGYILAVSIENESLFANPEEIQDPIAVAKILSPVIDKSRGYILKRLNRKKRFIWLKRKLDASEIDKVKSLRINGLYFKKEFKRYYPHGRTASNIIGFVDVDNNGLDGIEYKYDKILSGLDKRSFFQSIDKPEKGEIIEGKNIVLTVDKYIQHICEKEIKKGVIKQDAKQGVVTVLEVSTGRVLAIAKYPDFDPNYYNKYSDEARSNFSVVNGFEPGSTFKVIALAAIMEYAPDALKIRYRCEGKIEIGDATIKCGKKHGVININEIIKHSCNVGIIKAIREVDREDFHDFINKFGFGEKLGVDLPGEYSGILWPIDKWSGLSKYSISIGQEISVTSLQLTAAFASIGNFGIYLNPRIIESIERPDGSLEQSFYPVTKGRIISIKNSKRILKIMRNVVLDGTGQKAGLLYYKAVGKTGTGQKSMKRGGYYKNRFVSSFIGLAPMKKPDLCILVIIDEPENKSAGGDVAAPVFAKIADRVLLYRGIKLKEIPPIDPVKIKLSKRNFNGKTMPNFSGLTISGSLELLHEIQKKHNIRYSFQGNGKVYRQSLIPGTKLSNKTELTLFLKER